jgi:hypothetical protein
LSSRVDPLVPIRDFSIDGFFQKNFGFSLGPLFPIYRIRLRL